MLINVSTLVPAYNKLVTSGMDKIKVPIIKINLCGTVIKNKKCFITSAPLIMSVEIKLVQNFPFTTVF